MAEGEGLSGGGVIASGIEITDVSAIEDDFHLSGAVDVIGGEIDSEITGDGGEIKAKGDFAVAFAVSIPVVAVLGTG